MREIVGDAARWGETEHLLATLIDTQMYGNYLLAAAPHFKGRANVPPPIRRPGTPDPTKRIGGKRTVTRERFDKLRASMTPKAG